MTDLQIILQSSTIVSALGIATIISMGLSGFLYNGFFNKVWRAVAVMIGLAISICVLFIGLEEQGYGDASILSLAVLLCLICSTFGFYFGVWSYRNAHRQVKAHKGCKNCNLILKKV